MHHGSIWNTPRENLHPSILNLVVAIIDPSKNPLTGNEDLITLYMSKEGLDCSAGLKFGMDILQLLTKSRKVLGKYE